MSFNTSESVHTVSLIFLHKTLFKSDKAKSTYRTIHIYGTPFFQLFPKLLGVVNSQLYVNDPIILKQIVPAVEQKTESSDNGVANGRKMD